jgi:hypothetical protein
MVQAEASVLAMLAHVRTAKTDMERARARVLSRKIDAQREERLCVVCQVEPKAVVLLPCRHLCVCGGCANHSLLSKCPICRKAVREKLVVYA